VAHAPAFEQFVAARGPSLLRLAYMLTHSPTQAEDLVQEALTSAYRRWDAVEVADSPEAYVRRILVNQALSWRRRAWRNEIPAQLPEGPDGPADGVPHAVAERDLVWRIMAGLPARQRAVLVLRYYEDVPDEQIAHLLGCAPGTVRSLAARAFAALRAHPHLADYAEPTQGAAVASAVPTVPEGGEAL